MLTLNHAAPTPHRRIDRAAARRLAKLFDDGSVSGGGGGATPDPGFFGQQSASLNAPPNQSGSVGAPTGTWQKGYNDKGGPWYNAVHGAENGVMPTIPNALPPPSAGTVATGK